MKTWGRVSYNLIRCGAIGFGQNQEPAAFMRAEQSDIAEIPEKKIFEEKIGSGISSVNEMAEGYKSEIGDFEAELQNALPG